MTASNPAASTGWSCGVNRATLLIDACTPFSRASAMWAPGTIRDRSIPAASTRLTRSLRCGVTDSPCAAIVSVTTATSLCQPDVVLAFSRSGASSSTHSAVERRGSGPVGASVPKVARRPGASGRSADGHGVVRSWVRQVLPAPIRRFLRELVTRALRPWERRRAYEDLVRRASDAPQTFSEKVIHRMAFDRRPVLTTFADKVAVRDFVTERLGREYLPETYGIHRRGRNIDWDALPREFVLKASHGSGAVAIVSDTSPRGASPTKALGASWGRIWCLHPDDVDRNELARLADGWLRLSYEYRSRRHLPEWAYAGVPPRVMTEELLLGPDGRLPNDYKFFMMDGKCAVIQLVAGPFGEKRLAYFSAEWEVLPVTQPESGFLPPQDDDLIPPTHLDEMLLAAGRLSTGLDFVRVDLYDLSDRVAFGEMTNYPSAGSLRFDPAEFDRALGARWHLPARADVAAVSSRGMGRACAG